MNLAKHVVVGRVGNKGVFGAGSGQMVMHEISKWEVLVQVAEALIDYQDCSDVISYIGKKCPNISRKAIYEAYNFLQNNNFLADCDDFISDNRYSRNSIYYRLAGGNPSQIQNRLKNSTVLIVGCGGIGNHSAQMLSTSGVGQLLLVDNDIIEMSNLTRQFMFCEEDIGKKKVDILARELKKRNKTTSIVKYPMYINNQDDYLKIDNCYDLILLSADTPQETVLWTNRHCLESNIPFVNVGYINDISVYGPFVIPGKTACFECAQVVPDDVTAEDGLFDQISAINANFKSASFPTVNAVAASLAVNDALKYLGNYGEITSVNKRVGIHSLTAKIEQHAMLKNSECAVCGRL